MRKIYGLVFTFFGGIGSVWSQGTSVFAPDFSNQIGARALGRGGATSASELSVDSVFQNPASAGFTKQYAVGFQYTGAGDSISAAIVDTQSGPIGAGIFYSRQDFSGANFSDLGSSFGNFERAEESAGFSLTALPSPQFSVGSVVRWSYLKSFDDQISGGKAWNFDLGVIYKINSNVSLGALGQNFLRDPVGMRPRRFTAGVDFSPAFGWNLSAQIYSQELRTGSLANSFSFPNPSQKLGYSLGGQYRFVQGFLVRTGYSESKSWGEKFFSGGLGYEDKTFSLEYGFRSPVGATLAATLHAVSLTGYF